MINLAIAIVSAVLATLLLVMGLGVHIAISLPFGLILGVAIFFWMGRKMQVIMSDLQARMQKEIQAGKVDRAIDVLKSGMVHKNRHLFVAGQLNSLIGSLYYVKGKKEHDTALEYLKKGFFKNFMGHCMQGAIYYQRKDYDNMRKVMDQALSMNKKESFVYGMYAWLLYQIKEKDQAMAKLQAGLKKLPNDERLLSNLSLMQNNKKMKMKVYGEMWVQMMLERSPRMMQEPPRHTMGKFSRKQMFRGR